MCKLVEDYAKEREELGKINGKVETVKNMLKDNVPLETALKYAKIDKETFEKYSERMQ